MIDSNMLWRYDDFNKNFSNYLPNNILNPFAFVIIFRTKTNNIFGAFAEGLCDKDNTKHRAFLFSLTNKNVFYVGPKAGEIQSVKFQDNFLNFGNNELRLRNNYNK